MELKVLESSGFCPGVLRATREIEKALAKDDGVRICVLGELIHNRTYMDMLEEKGVLTVEVEDIERLARESDGGKQTVLFIRAHGVSRETEELLRRLCREHGRFEVRDMTCTFVRRIHDIVEENTAEDTLLLLFGTESHPEVEGIKGHAKGKVIVFSDPEGLDERIFADTEGKKRVIAVSQTTQSTNLWKKSQKKKSKTYVQMQKSLIQYVVSPKKGKQMQRSLHGTRTG